MLACDSVCLVVVPALSIEVLDPAHRGAQWGPPRVGLLLWVRKVILCLGTDLNCTLRPLMSLWEMPMSRGLSFRITCSMAPLSKVRAPTSLLRGCDHALYCERCPRTDTREWQCSFLGSSAL